MSLAQVDGHRLAARDRQHRLFLDFALQRVEPGIGGDNLLRERDVGGRERVHRLDHHLLGDAAHLGDAPFEDFEFLVVGFDGVIDHGERSLSRSGR